MCSGQFVLPGFHEPLTRCDAERGCHPHSDQCLGQNEAAADSTGKQTKRALWVCGDCSDVAFASVGGLLSTLGKKKLDFSQTG